MGKRENRGYTAGFIPTEKMEVRRSHLCTSYVITNKIIMCCCEMVWRTFTYCLAVFIKYDGKR